MTQHYDQHPVYGEKRMATEADAVRIQALGETIAERSRHALADSPNPSTTTVSLTARQIAILRSLNFRPGLADMGEYEEIEGKLRRAALRLYDRGIR